MKRPKIMSSRTDLRSNWPRWLAARISDRLINCGLAETRWAISFVLLVGAPKCFLCVAGYWGIAAGLGAAGMELCGGTSTGSDLPSWIALLLIDAASFALVVRARRFFAFGRAAVRDEAGHSLNHRTPHRHPLQSAAP